MGFSGFSKREEALTSEIVGFSDFAGAYEQGRNGLGLKLRIENPKS